MRPADNINDLIKKLQLRASADLDARVHDDISGAVAGHEMTESVRSEPSTWRTIMKGKTAKLAAAAVILIGVIVLTSVFVETNKSVVLAGVLERVEQAQAFMYKMDMTITGSMVPEMAAGERKIQATMIFSSEYGMKYEMDTGIPDPNTGKTMTQQMYVLPNQKLMLSLMPEQKKYMRMELTDDLLARTKKQNNDPREMMKQILDCKYTELGRSEINGMEVEGFETTDPKFSAGVSDNVEVKLWVDVDTWLPVLWEMDMTMNEQMEMHGVISDFQWDIPVVASDFEPVIPEDFTPMMDGNFKMPSMTEEAALEGLKLFVDMSGRYPKKLDMMSLIQEFSALEAGDGLPDASLELEEEIDQMLRGQDDTEAAIARVKEKMALMQERVNNTKATLTRSMETMRPIQSLGMFYMTLALDEKEPVYYGESVGPDDTDAVLMRWKASDGQYRVVFGDLSTSDVTPEELAQLERFSIDDGYKSPSMTEEAALGRDKSTATDHYNRGDAHYFNGEYDQAFSELTKAIEKDPELTRAYVTRGQAYNDKNKFDLAIADFTKVIEIEPTNASAYDDRGMAYGNNGEYDLAIADYSKAIEIDPLVAEPYRGRARAYYYKGEYDKAWKDVYEAQALGREVGSKLLEKLREASGRDE